MRLRVSFPEARTQRNSVSSKVYSARRVCTLYHIAERHGWSTEDTREILRGKKKPTAKPVRELGNTA